MYQSQKFVIVVYIHLLKLLFDKKDPNTFHPFYNSLVFVFHITASKENSGELISFCDVRKLDIISRRGKKQ